MILGKKEEDQNVRMRRFREGHEDTAEDGRDQQQISSHLWGITLHIWSLLALAKSIYSVCLDVLAVPKYHFNNMFNHMHFSSQDLCH